MNSEELIEEGIVISSSAGLAKITLTKSDHCEECSAKIICKPKSGDQKLLTVNDPYGTKPGDVVKISVLGSEILKISFLLYGFPLFLLLIPIFVISNSYPNLKNVELISFSIGVLLVAVYYLIVFLIKKNSAKSKLPKIISYSRNS